MDTQFGVAMGTLLVVVVALFEEQRRARFVSPRLKLKLLRKKGKKTQLRTNLGEVVDDVRYYHLQVWNERRWSPAEHVQVYLIRVDELGPSDELESAWVENVPIRWHDQEIVPLFQTIGAAKDCDFCRVEKKGGLSLMPLIVPNNLNARRQGKCKFAAWLQARSNQADPQDIRIQVSWDGLWENSDTEIQRHLEVRELSPEKWI